VSNCPGLHCPGCGGKGGLLAALGAAGAVIALVAAFAEELLIIAGTVVAVLLALIVLVVARAWRRGWRPSLDPVVAYTPLPEPERRPVSAAHAAQALPAPQTVNYFSFYGVAPEQVAEVVRRQAITDRRTS
jgi:hypothetical protein